jgi:hypothetical protein
MCHVLVLVTLISSALAAMPILHIIKPADGGTDAGSSVGIECLDVT